MQTTAAMRQGFWPCASADIPPRMRPHAAAAACVVLLFGLIALWRLLPGNDTRDLAVTCQKLMEALVEPRLACVDGVSDASLEGGRPREAQVRFDPYRIAALGLTPQRLAQAVVCLPAAAPQGTWRWAASSSRRDSPGGSLWPNRAA